VNLVEPINGRIQSLIGSLQDAQGLIAWISSASSTFILREGREAANIQACSRIIRENSKQMRFDDVILGRRSIRGYKPDPVPKALIEEIIGLAMRAPSSMNTQPWNF
jgi:hypothetical protein